MLLPAVFCLFSCSVGAEKLLPAEETLPSFRFLLLMSGFYCEGLLGCDWLAAAGGNVFYGDNSFDESSGSVSSDDRNHGDLKDSGELMRR